MQPRHVEGEHMEKKVAVTSRRNPSRASRWLLALIAALAAGWLPTPRSSHAVTLTTVAASPGSLSEIRVSGAILPGDADQLAATLQSIEQQGGLPAVGPRAIVSFDSRGGALEEGMRIGRLLRRFGAGTLVRAGDRCLSACALAFVGGTSMGPQGAQPYRRLAIGGQLGFHAFYVMRDPDSRDAATSRARGVTEGRAASAVIIAYVMEMGVDPEDVLRALVRPPEDITYIETAGEFVSLGLCPVDLVAPHVTAAEQATNVCTNASQGVLPAWPDLIVQYTPMEARRLLIGQVAAQAGKANVRSGLATRLQQVLRGGRGTEAIYDELAAAGLPLPAMRARAYHLELPDGRMSCLVTLSPSDRADYGVVLITPTGLVAPRALAPNGCPELFTFGHDEIINPRRLAAGERN